MTPRSDDPGRRKPVHEEISELTTEMTGVWLVTTRHSSHVWDLDRGTYERRPGPRGQTMPYDGHPVPICRVECWPQLGGRALVFYDDPDRPGWEQYRMCSAIASIRRLDNEATPDEV